MDELLREVQAEKEHILDTLQALKEALERKEMNIIEEAKNITCPLLLVHTEHDFVVNVSGVKRMIENVSSEDKELKIFPGGAHCADEDDELAGSYIADWMIERLMK